MVSNSKIKRVIICVMLIVGGVRLYLILPSMRGSKVTELSYSDLLNRVDNKGLATAVIEPEQISGQLTDKSRYSSPNMRQESCRDFL